jgi:hypothetical protein
VPSLAHVVEPADELAKAVIDPSLLHFARSFVQTRPWLPACIHPRRAEWLEALDRTAWAGWRPDVEKRSILRRSAGRLKRSAEVLIRG